ncbi:uncharacterized protein TrAFT101_000721 [Trichoderma asperellum]|uniref:uncharacterized protein n=1 Tax=Trichoderma asperellum TaxID=101201 RepID=UPI003333FA02|nr:hypothetical protein TrAFT101_000721 [Trichoderma asperellum]
MTSCVSRPSLQMAAIFSCEMCSEAYASPADLDHHRQIHDIDNDPGRIAVSVACNTSKAKLTTVDQACTGKDVATPAVTTRCFFFCSTCNTRVESPRSLRRHNEQFHLSNIKAFVDENLPGTCQRCHRHSIECDCTPPYQSSVMSDTSEGYTLPSLELSWSPGSASGSSTSQEQSPTSPAQPSNSLPCLAATVFSPQYVAHMPPIPESDAIQTGDVSWIDFLAPVERREPCVENAGFEDSNFSPLTDHFWQRPVDMHLSGYNSPGDVLAVSLESLRLLFDAGGVPRRYEAVEEQTIYLPAMNLLNQLCANYFVHWQQNQPVFHFSTWSFIEYPMALVSAMACVGSIFSKDCEVIRQASYISERCTSEINSLTKAPFPQYRDTEYIAALCIHQTYLIGSSHDQIHHHADRVRSYMIQGLQHQNLLGPNALNPGNILPRPSLDPDVVHKEWRAWADHEQKLRVAWMVFEYDCSLALLTGRPCAIALGHLPKVFPCEDALYNAPNAYAWAELLLSDSSLQGPLVSNVITLALDRLKLPHAVSSWTKRLCAHILERLLRGLLDPYQRTITIASALEINLHFTSSLSSIQMQLLWSISFLGKSASIYHQSPAAINITRDADDFSLSSRLKVIRHSDHFGLCTRILYTIRFITLAAISSPPCSYHTELPLMQQRLIQEFANAPYHARLYVYNAGQIFRVTRENPLVTPVDYLRIFTAYLAILAFVKYGPSSENDMSGGDPFQADVFPFFPTSSDKWLEFGGPATIGDCGVFYPGCSTEQIMRDASSQLCSSYGWKLKRRFYHVLVRFNALGARRD